MTERDHLVNFPHFTEKTVNSNSSGNNNKS